MTPIFRVVGFVRLRCNCLCGLPRSDMRPLPSVRFSFCIVPRPIIGFAFGKCLRCTFFQRALDAACLRLVNSEMLTKKTMRCVIAPAVRFRRHALAAILKLVNPWSRVGDHGLSEQAERLSISSPTSPAPSASSSGRNPRSSVSRSTRNRTERESACVAPACHHQWFGNRVLVEIPWSGNMLAQSNCQSNWNHTSTSVIDRGEQVMYNVCEGLVTSGPGATFE